MRKLGKEDPRQIDSFGVSGLLLEGCRVLASAVFGTQDVGRVSDLILARIRGTGLDELRARALLLYSVFEAYGSQLDLAMKGRMDGEPILMECGFDDEKIAIGISFCSPHQASEMEGMSERIANFEPKDHFESLLGDIHRHADRVIVRLLPGQRTEVISLFAIDPALLSSGTESSENSESADGKPAPKIIVFGAQSDVKPTPPAAEIVDLGDLDYAELLAEARGPAIAAAKAAFEKRIAAGERNEDGSLVTRVKGGDGDNGLDSSDRIRVSGGSTGSSGRELQLKVPGATQGAADDGAAVTVSGGDLAAPIPESDPRVQGYVARINELSARLAQLEADGGARAVGAAPAENSGNPIEGARLSAQARKKLNMPNAGVDLQELLSKIWPFRKGEKKPEAEAAATLAPDAVEPPVDQAPPAPASENVDEREAEGDALVMEIKQGQMAQAINRATSELEEIRKEASPRAQKWMDGLVSDLVSEKSRLSEVAKKYNVQARKIEIEARRRESSLQNQMEKKDEEIRQKEKAILHFKEQLATMTRKMEASKVNKKASEDEMFKQKYHETQRLLSRSKEESSKLQKKMTEMKVQVNSLQASLRAKSAAPANSAEVAGLKNNYEKVQRQADELRDTNARLQAQLSELTDKLKVATERSGSQEDSKRLSVMLEQASKNLVRTQREVDTAKKQKGDFEKENSKLKMEIKQLRLALTQAQTKTANAAVKGAAKSTASSGSKPGPGSTGGTGQVA